MTIDPGRPAAPHSRLAAAAIVSPEPGKPASMSAHESSERTKYTLAPRSGSQCTPRAISRIAGCLLADTALSRSLLSPAAAPCPSSDGVNAQPGSAPTTSMVVPASSATAPRTTAGSGTYRNVPAGASISSPLTR